MLRENLRIFKRLVFIADLCLVALGFQLAGRFDSAKYSVNHVFFVGENLLWPAVMIWGLALWYQKKCYAFRLRKVTEVIRSTVKASLAASGFFLTYVIVFALGYLDESRAQILMFAGLATTFLVSLRLFILSLLAYYRQRGFNYQTVLIVGTGKQSQNFTDKILNRLQYGLKVIGFLDWEKRSDLWRYRDIPCIGYLDDLPNILKQTQVDYVVFAVGRNYLSAIEKSLQICEEMGVKASVLADFFPTRLARRHIDSFFNSPMISYDPTPPVNLAIVMKGLFDRLMAVAAIVLASPVMLVTWAAIKLNSSGPAIFRQPRCGLNGRRFTLYKFRTMVPNAEALKKELMKYNEVDGAAFKMRNDPRITPLGKWLRKTSLDELPQLFNILRGDMSFVGPRPPLADEVLRYDLWQRRKLSMKPGLTCLWQVSGRSNVSFDQWMKLDLEYIDNWSLWKDAQILIKTVPAVLKGTGAR